MKTTSLKTSRRLLLGCLMIGGLAPALAIGAPPTHSFSVYGRAQFFQGAKPFATPFVGTMTVDPNFVDRSFGIVGRVVSITIRFPVLPDVPAFNTIVTQGPEISGITPLKYDVTILNANGEQVQLQFATLQSPSTFPGLGTPMGSLVNFEGGAFLEGRTGSLVVGNSSIVLQNFAGFIAPGRAR